MSETPETDAPETSISESDPNADSPEGLAGGMGVSSERPGSVRGSDQEVTYGAAPTYTDADEDATGEDVLPEQSAFDGRPEVQPDNDVPPHPHDPDKNPRHLGG
jgi:hypothetical protein